MGSPEWWEDSKQKIRKAATAVGIPQTTSSNDGDTKREEEAKSQVVHGRVAVTHGGKKREEDTSPGKSEQWIFDYGTTNTMTLMILTVSPHLLKPILILKQPMENQLRFKEGAQLFF